ncbi:MAG TPA: PEP-CTERM sorting domain-containing protein [Candidatus Omnitrophota bacterium]|nr:PEP-CTERM sorting domain-containing protein [Candidatus Omnitrophota bacterium]HQQ06386.1 PEP-CTERM sorting domain-containing protein [Candidatus Omnitrophota bacterium]
MKRTSIKLFVFSLIIFMALAANAFAAIQWDVNHTVALIYPSNMTYVDRADPLNDYGSDSYLKVGDERGNFFTEGNVTYFDAVNATRTYMRFSNVDLNELSGYTIANATLHMYLTSVIDGAGTATTNDTVNVRQVVSANGYNYISGLTWDGQADRDVSFTGGILFASRDIEISGESTGWKQWETAATGNGTIASMIDGWISNSSTNYGVVLENDFDGVWQELVNGTQYSIDNPTQMNELEAVFAKTQGSYPFLRVQVVPEPVSSVLMIVGAGVLGLVSSRRRKKIS